MFIRRRLVLSSDEINKVIAMKLKLLMEYSMGRYVIDTTDVEMKVLLLTANDGSIDDDNTSVMLVMVLGIHIDGIHS